MQQTNDTVIVIEVSGRVQWALEELMRASERGCTPIDTPGPRWSHYIWVLRGEGVDIETVTEKHGGPFSGTHARYVLRSVVVRLPKAEAA
ncbi:MAG: hypothetical protein AAGJ91_07560 [Pseudomonadota bacterium]